MKEVAALVRRQLEGIVAWAQTRQINGFLEAISGLFQAAKRRWPCHGFGGQSVHRRHRQQHDLQDFAFGSRPPLPAGGDHARGNGVGPAAGFNSPAGLAIDGADNLYVVDDFPYFGHAWQVVRKVTPAAQVSDHIRGIFLKPASIAADAAGNVYLTMARKILPDGTEIFFNAPVPRPWRRCHRR